MPYGGKTKAQLMNELEKAHRLITKLEKAESMCKQAKDALNEKQERCRLHYSLSNDISFQYDINFVLQHVSPNVERILGYKPDELVGRHFLELNLLDPEDMNEALDNALHVISGSALLSSLYQFITKDGVKKFGEVSGIPFMRNGRIVGVISIGRDITERIEMETMLHMNEETTRVILHSNSDPLLLLDTSGKILALNELAAETMRKTCRDLFHSHVFDHMPKETAKMRRQYFKQNIDSGKPVRFTDTCGKRPFQISLYPIHDPLGEVARIVVKGQDLSKGNQGVVL